MNKMMVAAELVKLAKAITGYEQSWSDDDPSAPKTPWGPAQVATRIAPGVTWYSTAGHGGMAVAPSVARSKLSPAALKHGERWGNAFWYEEDVAWLVAVYENPDWGKSMMQSRGTSPVSQEKLEHDIREWFPEYFDEAFRGKAQKEFSKPSMREVATKYPHATLMFDGLTIKSAVVDSLAGRSVSIMADNGRRYRLGQAVWDRNVITIADASGKVVWSRE